MNQWTNIGVSEEIAGKLIANNYKTPTQVQLKSLPLTLNSKDAIISAPTGEGKTLCFALPIIQKYSHAAHSDSPFALILAPTRELAMQIAHHINLVSDIKTLTIIGGMSKQKQERIALKKPPIIISTPGRLYDMIDNEYISLLHQIKFLVIDEADRMVQDGHFRELGAILDTIYGRNQSTMDAEQDNTDVQLTGKMKEMFQNAIDLNDAPKSTKAPSVPVKRQTIILSATIPLEQEGRFSSKKLKKRKQAPVSLMDKFTSMIQFRGKPKMINLTSGKQLNDKLVQYYCQVSKDRKDIALYQFIRSHTNESYIVFTNSITCCKRLSSLLVALNLKAFCLHSKMQQRQRLKNFERFQSLHNKKLDAILVCTDVAARGIDIPLVQHVIHYQFPSNAEVYIHRVGRTARMREGGDSFAIVGPEDYQDYLAVTKLVCEDIALWSYSGNDSQSLEQYVVAVRELESEQHQEVKQSVRSSTMKRLADEADLPDPELKQPHKIKKMNIIMPQTVRGSTVITPERAEYLNALSKRNIF
jgi:ATP-dependent RNA helicase DDX24/MAK5